MVMGKAGFPFVRNSSGGLSPFASKKMRKLALLLPCATDDKNVYSYPGTQ